ncbi:MAG: (Fe-S)-binding protein [Thermoguttaceae bacterium]|jgi:Fe-S oxidoreductase/nitrate reductase gamma subunit
METARPIMWNVPEWGEITLYLLIPVVLIAFVGAVAWRVRKWFLGRAEPGIESFPREFLRSLQPRRLLTWVRTALFQGRLSSDSFSLVMHLAIFWGMLVLFVGTALATLDQDFTNLLLDTQFLRAGIYRVFELALDIFGVVLILGLVMAAYRRYLVRPKRLAATRTVSLWDGFPFLTLLFLIAASGFVIEGLRIAEGLHVEARVAAAEGAEAKTRVIEESGLRQRLHMGRARQDAELAGIARGNPVFPAAAWAPVGYYLAKLLVPLGIGTIRLSHQLIWWLHALMAFTWIVAIPFTKAFHLISSPTNILLRGQDPPGRLQVAMESGVRTVRDLTWRQLLQADACTWCGKCQEVCPANHTGFPLSPRDLVQAVGSQLLRTPAKANGDAASLHGSLVKPEELWSCCTCRACEEICPVLVQQPRLIVDLRRHLVDQGQVDEGLQDALMNLQRYGNSFGQSARKRPEWAKPLDFKLKDARKEEVEYLWFVGDYASYDQRAQAVTRTVAKVLHQAGIDVGLLFEKEQNAGNDVRRSGEEGLFSMIRDKNAKELAAAKFRKLFTTDPHTYNTLKNEYRGNRQPAGEDSGNGIADKPVLHYTELLDELLRQGKLKLSNRVACTVTYHDPCYLGRFNGVYEAPRRVLRALGAKLIEMPRHGPNSFCCGAGGGRIWMKDTPGIGERPAENRVKEALALSRVECLVVACPKDLVMFQDAVKTVGAEGRLRVADLGELVYEAMGVPTPVGE